MEYITLSEAKRHLRVDYDDDDAYIAGLVDLVEELVKTEISGTFAGEGTVATVGTTALAGTDTNFSDFSVGDKILVDGETVRTLATITDDDTATVTVAFANTDSDLEYTVTTGLPLVDGLLPAGLRQAMLLILGHFYANRESIIIGVGATEIPMGFKYLITPYKNYTIA
jgi:hypothetical protein